MSIAGVVSNISRVYVDRSVLKFFVTRWCKKRTVSWDSQAPKVPLCDLTHLNPDIFLHNSGLEGEIELLSVLAHAASRWHVKYVIQKETFFENHNIPKIGGRTGRCCRTRCDFIDAPQRYSRIFSWLASDKKELKLTSQPFIGNERFSELQKMVSAYQGKGDTVSNQILNVLQLWCAEHNRCNYFLTLDLELIKAIRKQNLRPLTDVVKPSDLVKIILNNPSRRTYER